MCTENADGILRISDWGLPKSVTDAYELLGITSMFSWQAECLCVENVLSGKNLVYSAPTSGGKTLVAEILVAKQVLERHKKAVIVLPYVSVVREKVIYLKSIFEGEGIKVDGFMGTHNPPGGFSSVDIAVCTVEKGNNLVNKLLEDGKLNEIGIIVVDELHILGDCNRGYLLELLLTKILYQCKVNDSLNLQLVGMSATLPNLKVLASWLNAELYECDFRPVPLTETFKIGNVIYDESYNIIRDLSDILTPFENDIDHTVFLTLETVCSGFSALIFCPSKIWCENLSRNIAKEIFKLGNIVENCSEISYCHEFGLALRNCLSADQLTCILNALKDTPAGLDDLLSHTVSFGVAFHHAGLTFEEREVIEDGFRNGIIKVLVATSTLASGVNLPARRVIIRSPIFYGTVIDPLSYKQMVGRAGRKGIDTEGESVIIFKESEKGMAMSLMASKLPPVHSCLLNKKFGLVNNMNRAILEVIASGTTKSMKTVRIYISCTLLFATLTTKMNNDEIDYAENDIDVGIDECLKFLIENQFIFLDDDEKDSEDKKLLPSRLGLAVLASGFSPDDAMGILKELEASRKNFVLENDLHILYEVTPMFVSAQLGLLDWINFSSLWEDLSEDMKHVGMLVGIEEVFVGRAIRGTINFSTPMNSWKHGIHRRFYATLALNDLIQEKPISSVSKKYQCNRGIIQSLQQTTATFAGMLTIFCQRLGWNNLVLLFSSFQKRLHFGIQPELCDLVRLSTVNGKLARMLYDVGLENVSAVANANPEDIALLFYNFKSFQRVKNLESKKLGTAAELDFSKQVWIAGQHSMNIKEAALTIVKEAQDMIQQEIGGQNILWNNASKLPLILKQDEFQSSLSKVSSSSGTNVLSQRKSIVSLISEDFSPNLEKTKLHQSSDCAPRTVDLLGDSAPINLFSKNYSNSSLSKTCSTSHFNKQSQENINEPIVSQLKESTDFFSCNAQVSDCFAFFPVLISPDHQHTDFCSKYCEAFEMTFHPLTGSMERHMHDATYPEGTVETGVQSNLQVLWGESQHVFKSSSNAISDKAAEVRNTEKSCLPQEPKFSSLFINFGKQASNDISHISHISQDIFEPMQHVNLSQNNWFNPFNPLQKKIFSTLVKPSILSSSSISSGSQDIFSASNMNEPVFEDSSKSSHNIYTYDIAKSTVPFNSKLKHFDSPSSCVNAVISTNLSNLPRKVNNEFDKQLSKAKPFSSSDVMCFSSNRIAFEQLSIDDKLINNCTSFSSGQNISLFAKAMANINPSDEQTFGDNFTPHALPAECIDPTPPKSTLIRKCNLGSTIQIDRRRSVIQIPPVTYVKHSEFDSALDHLGTIKEISFSLAREERTVTHNGIGPQALGFRASLPLSDSEGSTVVGISFYYPDKMLYLSFGDPNSEGCVFECVNSLRNFFGRVSDKVLRVYDLQAHYDILYRMCGIVLPYNQGVIFEDPIIAYSLLKNESSGCTLHRLVNKFLPQESHLLQGLEVQPSSIGLYADPSTGGVFRSSTESYLVFHLMKVIKTHLARCALLRTFYDLEMPLILFVSKRDQNGIGVDHLALEKCLQVLKERVNLLKQKAYRLAGRRFNIHSSKDIATVLYRELRLFTWDNLVFGHGVDATKYTDTESLQLISDQHPLPEIIILHRKYDHYINRVVTPLLRQKKYSSNLNMFRLHGCSNVFSKTGRIYIHCPALQFIPKEDIPEVDPSDSMGVINLRELFLPSKDKVFLSVDYSQLELRVLAHLSHDEKLINCLNSEMDIFVSIACALNNLPSNLITSESRDRAKVMCYSIIYGITATSLARKLKISVEKAVSLVKDFHERFPGLKKYQQSVVENVHLLGFVETVLKYRRYISVEGTPAASLERIVLHRVIQGSASDIFKIAVVSVNRALIAHYPETLKPFNVPSVFLMSTPLDRLQGRSSFLTTVHMKPKPNFKVNAHLQSSSENGAHFVMHIHDELIFEVPEKSLFSIASIIKYSMENCIKLRVNLPVLFKYGNNWHGMRALNAC